MTRTPLEGLGKGLRSNDEVAIEATVNGMVVLRVQTPFVARVIIARSVAGKGDGSAHFKTDKIDNGTLANLQAGRFSTAELDA